MAALPTLPNVVGKALDSAINALAWTKLTIVQIESVTTAKPRGTVIAQRPPGGTPLRLTKVDTLVSAAPARRIPIGAIVRRPVDGVVPPPASATTPATGPPARTPRDTGLGSLTHVTVPGAGATVPGVVVRDDTYVPQLVGRSPQTASALLERARLKLGNATRDYSEDVAAGLVFRQHPEYSRVPVAAGTQVDVWYSLGPRPRTAPTFTVPSVIGMTLAQAATTLGRARLKVGHVDSVAVRGGDGTVQHQRPDPGAIAAAGDGIDLSVSVAPRFVIVPDVTHATRDVAESRLAQVGLGLGRVTLVTTPATDTTIIAQHPTAASEVPPGTLVDIVENRPPLVRRVTVPDLTGLTRGDAERRLAADSLFLGDVLVTGDTLARQVASQDPRPGTSVFLYSTVNVTLQAPGVAPGTDSQFVRVPSVVNLSAEMARLMLADSGFVNVSVRGDSATAAGIVAAQSPPAGTLATPSATVALVVSAPVGPPVPQLIGMTEAAARAESGRHQMLMTVAGRHRAFRWRDVVVSQSPAPPAIGPADNTITVDLDVPVVPPIPAAIVLVAAGVAAVGKWKPRPQPNPPPVAVRLTPVVKPEAPPSFSTGAGSLIHHRITLRYGAAEGPWSVEPNDRSLITPESRPHA